MKPTAMAVAALFLAACGEPPPYEPQSIPATAWCEHAAGGPPASGEVAVQVSAAHALYRFFGPVATTYAPVDAALAAAMNDPGVLFDGATYAGALDGACWVPSSTAPLPPASVELAGSTAVIHPGAGPVEVPASASAVAIDLRGFPAATGGGEALAAALAAATATPVPGLSTWLRTHEGLEDEFYTAASVYSDGVSSGPVVPYTASAAANRPLAILTGDKLSPAAAELAIAVRTARRGWLFGAPVYTAVAEARWAPVAGAGVLVRTRTIHGVGDALQPDVEAAGLDDALAALDGRGEVPAARVDRTARRTHAAVLSFNTPLALDVTLGTTRAAAVITHGVLRRFFPYFAVVGDSIDERLIEVLGTIDATPQLTRPGVRNLLRRLGEALSDGHVRVYDRAATTHTVAVVVEHLGGEPVVLASGNAAFRPGDTVVAVGGRPAADLYAEELPRTSAATDGFRRHLLFRELVRRADWPIAFSLRDPAGTIRTEQVSSDGAEALSALGSGWRRAHGFLTDLGGSTIYYLNLDAAALTSSADFEARMADAQTASALVVDMRGYPGVNHYAVVARLLTSTANSAHFMVPQWSGPDSPATADRSYALAPDRPFTGPIVLLVGNATVSAAENFSMILTGADRVTVVGRPSAGTNGNITGVRLPGGFDFLFTGMEVRFPDGSVFHGVGIQPDVLVTPTAADLRDGVDRELLAAIQHLNG